MKYVGHVVRNEKTCLMASVLQGKTDAPRRKGRPSITFIDNIKEISGLNIDEVTHKSRDREAWRRVTKTACAAANIDPDDADR